MPFISALKYRAFWLSLRKRNNRTRSVIKMNKETLFSLMPIEVIKEEDVDKKIKEQRKFVTSGKTFATKLSINRFLYKKLADFDIDEILNLFSKLSSADFVINENDLFFDLDIGTFAAILEEEFHLDNMYELDNLYLENLLNGRDITKEEINVFGENMSFADVLVRFVFQTSGMSLADTPKLTTMLTAKKALLGSYLAVKNIESLLNGQKEIYDISVLM